MVDHAKIESLPDVSGLAKNDLSIQSNKCIKVSIKLSGQSEKFITKGD